MRNPLYLFCKTLPSPAWEQGHKEGWEKKEKAVGCLLQFGFFSIVQVLFFSFNFIS